jgi:hypothetical protein
MESPTVVRTTPTVARLLAQFDEPVPDEGFHYGTGDFNDTFRKDYARRGLVLVLGAGVSAGDAKKPVVPLWSALLERLAEQHLGGPEILKTLQATHSLPAIAGILQDAINANGHGAYVNALRTELYGGTGLLRTSLRGPDLANAIRDLGLTNLRAVASFCAVPDPLHPGRTDAFVQNPLVRAVVTFNVDTLLQNYANAQFPGRRPPPSHEPLSPGEQPESSNRPPRILRTIERPSAGPGRGINLYHMHGSLEFRKKEVDSLTDEASDSLVFTEQEYFDFFNRPLGRFSYTMLYLLRENPCLFIGTSMVDDNIRRLLHYSKLEVAQGYAAEIGSLYSEARGTDETIEREIATARLRLHRHYAILKRSGPSDKEPLSQADKLRARALYRLGVRTAWVKKYADIAPLLKELYLKARPHDERVWQD